MDEINRISWVTSSGIPLKAVYTPEDIREFDYSCDCGVPGTPPFTRGIYPEMYRSQLWGIKQIYGHGTVYEMNERFKLALQKGQTRLSFAIDNPTLYGIDVDDPRVGPADTGVMGSAVNSMRDFEVMFDGIPIDKIYVDCLLCVPFQAPYFAMYAASFENNGLDLKNMKGACHNDMIIAYVTSNIFDPIPPAAGVRLLGDMVEWCVEHTPKWVMLGTNPGYNAREGGCTAYEELALGFANAICQIDEVLRRGRLKIDDFAWTMGFHLSSDRDFFEEIAKFRAGRRMWYKLMKERYGAKDPKSLKYRFHVQIAGSNLTYQQPLNNITRIAYQVLAAALGGAQSICANTYLEAICEPTEEAELISIRAQQIAQHEIGADKVADPLGGSYYIEWLTNELETRAWDYLRKIEDVGGLVKAIETGWIHREFAQRMTENERKVATGEKKVVGVNCFKMDTEPYKVTTLPTTPGTYEMQKNRLVQLKKERNNEIVKQKLDNIYRALEKGENVMPAMIDAAKHYATLGEMSNVLREVFGVFSFPMSL